MSFDFDLNELFEADKEEALQQPPVPKSQASAKVVMPIPVPIFAPAAQRKLTPVEQRLARANVYRMVLSEPIFESDESNPEIRFVEEEIRSFCTVQLEQLLGLRAVGSAAVKSQFSDVETQVLKALVGKIMNQYERKKQIKAQPTKPVQVPVPMVVQEDLPLESEAPMEEPPAPKINKRRGRPRKVQQPEQPAASEPEPAETVEAQAPSERGVYRLQRQEDGSVARVFDPNAIGQSRAAPTGLKRVPMPSKAAYAAVGVQQAQQQLDALSRSPAGQVLLPAIAITRNQ